jgi:Domain of unknown function (DUF4406)
MKPVLVYLSGPITPKHGRSSELHVATALDVHFRLINLDIPNFCPHLSAGFPSSWAAVGYDRWLAYSFAMQQRCTHTLMLPHWQESRGALLEWQQAIRLGQPIAHTEAQLFDLITAPSAEHTVHVRYSL